MYANALLFDSLGCLDGRRCIFRDQRTASRCVILTRMQAVSSNCCPYSSFHYSKEATSQTSRRLLFCVCFFPIYCARSPCITRWHYNTYGGYRWLPVHPHSMNAYAESTSILPSVTLPQRATFFFLIEPPLLYSLLFWACFIQRVTIHAGTPTTMTATNQNIVRTGPIARIATTAVCMQATHSNTLPLRSLMRGKH